MANILTEPMKTMLAEQMPFVATVSPDGVPNLGPKRSLRPLDDSTLVFSEAAQGQTLENIRNGSMVAAAVVDAAAPDGYRFVGPAEVVESGPAWDAVAADYEKLGRPAPRYVVAIHVEEIYSLAPGPRAGKRI